MDALKQQLLKVQQQLAGLSASQKMLTASLLVIMVMTLFYWSRFAATSEMAVVAAPTAADLPAAKNALSAAGIKYELQGESLLVPIEKRLDAQAALALNASGLGQPSDKVYREIITGGNFFENSSMQDRRAQAATMAWLQGVMGRWPGVKTANVLLSGEKKLGILHSAEATASVDLSMPDAEPDEIKKTVRSARNLVAFASAGTKVSNISVVVNGQDFRTDSDNPMGSMDDQLAIRAKNTQWYQTQVMNFLHIPKAQVSVAVKVDNESSVTSQYRVEPKNSVVLPTHLQTTNEVNPAAAPSGEPGAVPNMGVMPEAVAAAPEAATKDTSDTKNNTDYGRTQVNSSKSAGSVVLVGASVNIPESYVRRVLASRKKGAEPTDADIAEYLAVWTPRWREGVRTALGLADASTISVGSYVDFDEPVPDAVAAGGSALAAMPVGGAFGVKEGAIGALAVLSLFMVMMMVRKGTPQPVLAPAMPSSAVEPEEMPTHAGLLTVNDMVGEVAEMPGHMTGHELTPEQLEAKAMIEQVGSMVKDNPDTAASLIKRWLNQD